MVVGRMTAPPGHIPKLGVVVVVVVVGARVVVAPTAPVVRVVRVGAECSEDEPLSHAARSATRARTAMHERQKATRVRVDRMAEYWVTSK
jgi:hypothetical protein